MNRTHRIIISVVLVVASAALAYVVMVGLRGRAPTPPPSPPDRPGPELVVTSPVMKHTEGGKPAWKIILDEMELAKGGATVAARGLREGIIYDEAGKPALRITAKQVQGETARKNFHLTGNVVVTSPKGFVIKTEEVDWINDEQRIHCPGVVLMKANNLVISTTELNYLLKPDLVKCPNQVRMYSGNNRVVGRSLTYQVKTGITDIIGGVQMVINPAEAKDILKEWSSQ